jgi:surface protein
MGIMFGRCSSLTSLDLSSFNTNKLSNMNSMFYGCTNLVTLNVDSFVLSSFSRNNNGISACFTNCTSLSNNSLNSILKMLSTWTASFSDKTLAKAGLTQTQAETCTTLSNWQACVDVGWSTGY